MRVKGATCVAELGDLSANQGREYREKGRAEVIKNG